jgi:hypothetical protein
MIAAGWTTANEAARLEDIDLEIEIGALCQLEKKVGKEGCRRASTDDAHARAIGEMQAAGVGSDLRSQALGQGGVP